MRARAYTASTLRWPQKKSSLLQWFSPYHASSRSSDGSRRKFSVFTRAVTCSYGSLLATVSYQLLPYMFGVKFSRTSAPYIYSAFFIRILIDVCYTIRYPDYLAHAHKYTYSKYQAFLFPSLEAWDLWCTIRFKIADRSMAPPID